MVIIILIILFLINKKVKKIRNWNWIRWRILLKINELLKRNILLVKETINHFELFKMKFKEGWNRMKIEWNYLKINKFFALISFYATDLSVNISYFFKGL